MKQVEIKLTLSTHHAIEVMELVNQLEGAGTDKAEPIAPKKTVRKKTVEKKEVAEKPAETKKADSKIVDVDEPTIEIKDVRALLSKKVGEHRTDIKAKLTDLGANNVTSLDVDNYPEFMGFLNSL